MRFVLLHSPVVGPSTWRWVAETLRSAGHEAVVPNLVAPASTGAPDTFARAAAKAAGGLEETIVVGHSGAGATLPLVAAGTGSTPRLVVFVDAGIPPCEGTFSAGGDHVAALRQLARDGVLPIWSQWWGEGMFEALIPDDQRRREVEQELPQLPLAFFQSPVEVPTDWCTTASAFVLLSEAYRSEAARASLLGWPVVERLGAHLDIVNDESAIADILLDLVRA